MILAFKGVFTLISPQDKLPIFNFKILQINPIIAEFYKKNCI